MAKIQISTTIDITNTGVRRPDLGSEKEYNQYRNYTTFLQVLGLRALFEVVQEPSFDKDKWTLVIDTDRDQEYFKDGDPVGHLLDDLDKVPVVNGLNEVKPLKQPVITTKGKSPNTIVTVLQ